MNTVECRKGLPIEYEWYLIEKYNSFITSCRYIEVYFRNYDINYMLMYEDNKLEELIVFGNKGNTSFCFNSLVEIEQKVIIKFVKTIFEKYEYIHKVKIEASYRKYFLNKSLLFFKSNDQVLKLPASIEGYYLELGYHTRKNIRNRKVRLSRDFKKVEFVTKYGPEIEESIVNKIIELNAIRMKNKGKTSGIDNTYKSNIYKYSKHYGCISYLEINNIIVAGCISTIINKGIFLHVIGHDNDYSKYNVGELCIVNLIKNTIEKGISTFHFLWGETEIKKRFLAKPQVLYSYYIFRTYSVEYFSKMIKKILLSTFFYIKECNLSIYLINKIKSLRKKYLNR